MTCQTCRDVVLDLARGVSVPRSLSRNVDAHVGECRSCAAELRRQRELTAAFRTIVAESRGLAADAALEQRLGAALVEQRHQASAQYARRSTWRWAALAAGVVLATLALWRAADSPRAPIVQRSASDAAPIREAASAIVNPGASEGASLGVMTSQPARAHRIKRPRRVDVARNIRPVEFIAIPAAAGLPALESGRIIRMEVPISTLHAYGVAVVADSPWSAVQADLLVGQDGQPRAIRLVANEQKQAFGARSRQ